MLEYRERLHVPLAWWLLAVPTILILGGTLYAGLPQPWPIIIFAGLTAGCAAALIALGWATVQVSGGTLRAGSAVLVLASVSEVVTLDERQSTRLRGPQADPAARICLRPYLKESVYVALDAAGAEPPGVPYWLIGTRHPTQLAAAIERCRVRPGHEPVA
jgi:Protein of unknown function (DUF3093)